MLSPTIWRWGRWPEAESEMMRLKKEMNRLFADVFPAERDEFPQINVWAGDNDALIVSEIPGIDADTLEVSIINDSVTLSGKRIQEPPAEGISHQRQERFQGAFKRTLQLPFKINAGTAEARYDRGLMTIKVFRADEDKPKKIAITCD